MTSSGNQQGMYSIHVSQALLPQFQLLMELASLRKRGANIGSCSHHGRESLERKGTEEDLAEPRVQGAEECNEVKLLRAMVSKQTVLRAGAENKQ